MKLLAGPLGELCAWAASVPLLTVCVLGILGVTDWGGWPYYAAMAVFLFVAVPIHELRRRAKKAASGWPSVTD
jgi:hypothetical protein